MAMNPYQSPRAESELPDQGLPIEAMMSEALGASERVSFDFQLNRRDVSRVVMRTKLRPDLRTVRNAGIGFFGFAMLIGSIALFEWRGGEPGLKPFSLTGLLLILSVYFVFTYVWLVGQLKRANADRVGHLTGWIDRNHLWINSEHQTTCHPLKQLVAATIDRNRMSLCFDSTHNFFFVFPIRGFDNAPKIVEIGQGLAKIRPPQKPLPGDFSRLKPPEVEPMFRPADDAVFFSGRLTMDDAEGSRFSQRFRDRKRWELFKAVALFGVIFITIHLLADIMMLSIFAGVVFLFTLARIVARLRSIGGADANTLWVSKGWFDNAGIVSIHSRGQSLTKWSMFDEFEITPKLLAMQARQSKNWHMTGREQFNSEGDWQIAISIANAALSS